MQLNKKTCLAAILYIRKFKLNCKSKDQTNNVYNMHRQITCTHTSHDSSKRKKIVNFTWSISNLGVIWEITYQR